MGMRLAGPSYSDDVIAPTNSIIISIYTPTRIHTQSLFPRQCRRLIIQTIQPISFLVPFIAFVPLLQGSSPHLQLVTSLFHFLFSFSGSTISSEPRRAAVALILRVVPPHNFHLPPKPLTSPSLTQFFDLDWVKHPAARPEILFVRRQKPDNAETNENTRDAHVAFPGGRTEEGDEGSLYTGTVFSSLPQSDQFVELSSSYASNLGRNRP
jgi:hypothetical protein